MIKVGCQATFEAGQSLTVLSHFNQRFHHHSLLLPLHHLLARSQWYHHHLYSPKAKSPSANQLLVPLPRLHINVSFRRYLPLTHLHRLCDDGDDVSFDVSAIFLHYLNLRSYLPRLLLLHHHLLNRQNQVNDLISWIWNFSQITHYRGVHRLQRLLH